MRGSHEHHKVSGSPFGFQRSRSPQTKQQPAPHPLKLHDILKLAHEDPHNPVSFVVPVSTTPTELQQLLSQIREAVRAHQFGHLGMHIQNDSNRYDISGAIWIYRGHQCLSESYTEGPMPCGEGTHYVAYYMWGKGGMGLNRKERFECDEGGYQGAAKWVYFDEEPRCQRLAESRGKVPHED